MMPMRLVGDASGLRAAVVATVIALLAALAVLVGLIAADLRYPLLTALGIAAVPPDDPARANAALRSNAAAFFGPDSYPDAAREAGEQGRVVALLAIAPNGMVTACRVVERSGSARLDAQTCRIALDAVRFDPARDARGRATASTYRLAVRRQLPSE